MIFDQMKESYINEAIALAIQEYQDECSHCKGLPKEDIRPAITSLLHALMNQKYGCVALEDGQVIGYLLFYGPMDGFFGEVKGVFSPLGGSAFCGKDRGRLASFLFEHTGNQLAEDGICSYALSRYAHDEEVGQSFIMNGFGIRCSDAIIQLNQRPAIKNAVVSKNPDLSFEILTGSQKYKIEPLHHKLVEHLAFAPTLFPTYIPAAKKWYRYDDIRIFAAKKEDQYIGYLALTDDDAETFITEHPKMANICGAYVSEDCRGTGVAVQLLEYLCETCEQEGKLWLGVDCETLNPTALHFWSKYFEPYTWSYARRIDERIVGYRNYLDQEWSKIVTP
ncbi:MAG: GNAT family N-acetyltransferase [bacterium]|nr:GNAT family N-acetyltransferase [bacterium]